MDEIQNQECGRIGNVAGLYNSAYKIYFITQRP